MGKTRKKSKSNSKSSKGNNNLLTFGVLGVFVLLVAMFAGLGGGTASLVGGGDINIEAPLAATPTVTLMTPDKYNTGTAVTTQNMYRQIISSGVYGTWVDVAGAGTFSLAAGTEIEYVIGIDSDDESAEPYGAHVTSYIVERSETSTIVEYVANDAAATDLSGVYFDEYDAANTAQTFNAAEVKTLAIKFTGAYEKDFGNINVGEMSNVLTVTYNKTQIDSLDVTSIVDNNGKSYPVTIVNNPGLVASALGTKSYAFPVIESNNGYKAMYNLDGDNSVAVNTTITALTFELRDSGYYLDSNDNTINGGVEDEDDAEIGAAAADSITPSIGA